MFAKQIDRRRGLGVIGIAILAVVIGAWILPTGSAEGATPAVLSTAPDGKTMTIDINVPLNDIQEGQYCQAYGLAYNYTGSLTFDWGLGGGQLTNADAFNGPLGTRQIAGDNFYASAGQFITLRVFDATDTITDIAYLNIDSSHGFNDECGA